MRSLLLLAVCALLAACGEPAPESAEPSPGRVYRVTAANPVMRDVEHVLTAIGSIESIHTPTVSAETSGQVREIAVREGDRVARGQLLAALDATLHDIETAKAEAELRRLNVLVDNQSSEVQRLRRLSESRSVSRDQLEDEQAQLEMLAAQRDIARKQWEHHQYMATKTRVQAPLGGLVSRRLVSVGDYVAAGQPLFKLVSVNRLRARIPFPEHAAADIALGKTVRLTSPSRPGSIATGTVDTINPQINPLSRTMEVTVEFDNPGGWLPGASVDTALVVEHRLQVATLPAIAVVKRAGQDVAFVVSGTRVRPVPVTPGWREDDWVEITGDIGAADQVVIMGADLLSDGSQVEVENVAP